MRSPNVFFKLDVLRLRKDSKVRQPAPDTHGGGERWVECPIEPGRTYEHPAKEICEACDLEFLPYASMQVGGVIHPGGSLDADVLGALKQCLVSSCAPEGVYRVGDFEVLWADGGAEVLL